MDCARFETLLFAGLDSEPGPDECASMSQHEESCERCRHLAALVRGSSEPEASTITDRDLTAAILTRTSGNPCEQASVLLADGMDHPLLRLHIASCSDCAALERALAWQQRDVLMLAEADPGPDFVAGVLAATLALHAPASAASSSHAHARRRDRMSIARSARIPPAGIWQRLVRRPRIALEGSYLVAMLALFVFGLPSASDAENSVQALDAWWRERAESAREVIENAGESVWDTVFLPPSENLRSLWNENAAGAVEPDATN